MDVEDVSTFDQYFKLMERQKKTLQAASRRQGERPKDRKPRAKAIDDHMMQCMSIGMMKLEYTGSGNHTMHSSFIAPPYLPSVASFKELEKVLLEDLQLETHHRGLYVLLRAVTPPVRMTGIMVVMEDERDDVVMLQLYQQEDEKDRPARDVVGEKGVCIVKEPYFKLMANGDYGLRIDHVSDLIWLSETDGRVPLQWRPRISQLDKTADEWKCEGNAAMKAEEFFDAVKKQVSMLCNHVTLLTIYPDTL